MSVRLVIWLSPLLLILAGCATPPEPVQLDKANVLPLELNSKYKVSKVKQFYNQPEIFLPTPNETVSFERQRLNWGSITYVDKLEKQGNYYDFFWKAGERADVTVRFEYRQMALGNFVRAKEVYFPEAKGTFKTTFNVIGDEYIESGRVSAWRVLLIVNGRIVGLRQSFTWK